MTARLRADCGALAVLGLAALLLLAPALAGRSLYYRDITLADVPGWAWAFRSLAAGQLPIWNPMRAGGLAQQASLHPFSYPLYGILLPAAPGWMGWGQALGLFLALHYWLAGACTYALARHWRWSAAAALTAAAAYQLGGYLVSLNNLVTNVPPAAMMSLLVLLLDRLLRRPAASALAAFALAFGLQVACARPDMSLMTTLLLIAYAGWRCRSWGALAAGAAALLLGLAINAVMLVPAREFVAHTNRSQAISMQEVTEYSLSPLQLAGLILPGWTGSPETGDDWARQFINHPEGASGSYLLTLYAGIVTLVLACFARSPRGQPGLLRFLALVGVLSLLLAFGKYLQFYAWFARIPLVAYVRFPVKFSLLWSWCLALAAGTGVLALQRGAVGRRWPLCLAILALAATVLLACTVDAQQIVRHLMVLDYRPWAEAADVPDVNAYLRPLLPDILAAAWRAAWVSWLLAAATLGLIGWARNRGGSLVVLPLLLVADLLAHNAGSIFYTSGEYFATPPLASYLAARATRPPARLFMPYGETSSLVDIRHQAKFLSRADRSAATGYHHKIEALMANVGMLYGLPGAATYAPYGLPQSTAAVMDYLYPEPAGQAQLSSSEPGLAGYTRVAGALGIGYFLVSIMNPGGGPVLPPPQLRANPNLELVWQSRSGLLLYRNRHLLPRAYYVPDALVVPNLDAALAALPIHARSLDSQVVLVHDKALDRTVALRAHLPRRNPGRPRRCAITAYANTRVLIANDSPTAGFVVLADNYETGWEVLVDGQPRPMLLANAFARAVYVEAGAHEIEFRYRPRSLAIGMGVSLAALAVLAWLALPGLRPRWLGFSRRP